MPWNSYRSDGAQKVAPLGPFGSSHYAFTTRNANLTLAVGWTTIAFDSVVADPDGCLSSGNYICKEGGYYQIDSIISTLLMNNPQLTMASIYVNGVETARGQRVVIRGGTGGDQFTVGVTKVLKLSVGDSVSIRVYNDGGNASTAGIVSTLTVAMIGVLTPTISQGALVTSLPASPVDGQEVRYLADATVGIVWNLKYRAGSASAYKWEWIGGSPLRNMVNPNGTMRTNSATPYAESTLASPQLTLPLAGDYVVSSLLSGFAQNTYSDFRVYPRTNSGTIPWEGAWQSIASGAQGAFTMNAEIEVAGLSAGAVASIRHMCSIASAQFTQYNTIIRAQPVRVG